MLFLSSNTNSIKDDTDCSQVTSLQNTALKVYSLYRFDPDYEIYSSVRLLHKNRHAYIRTPILAEGIIYLEHSKFCFKCKK